MTTEELREKAISGAKFYLDYLSQHQPEASAVHLMEPPHICSARVTELKVTGKAVSPNALRVVIDGEQITNLRLQSGRQKDCVMVYGDSSVFIGKDEENVLLIPDMRFIAEHLLSFFQSFQLFPLPKCTQNDSPDVLPGFSCSQYIAVYEALTEDFVYIEGLPGSGKTTHVLAPSIVWMIAHDYSAVLTAPTNHSLDATLTAVLQQMQQAGEHAASAVRLGEPTPEFHKEFSQVCLVKKEKGSMEEREEQQAAIFEQVKHAKLLAGTIDTIIWFAYKGGFRRFQPERIFLDEAAYTPLIKVLALLALQTNLTFLGDGQQLAPVCSVKQSVLMRPEGKGACLWALPAYELDSVLSCTDLETAVKQYFINPVCPDYQLFGKDNLVESFRYGGRLAEVLSENVYHGQLIGKKKKHS